MPTTYQQRLEILYKRTSYADTYRIITNFTTKWIKLKISYTNADKVLYSNKYCGRDCYIRNSNNDFIALYFLLMFAPQAIPKLSKILHTDIVHTLNWDAIPSSHNIKHIGALIKLDDQQQWVNRSCISPRHFISKQNFKNCFPIF